MDNKENKAYLYLVKTPSSNDLAVCASDSIFYPGTYVVSPSRYGMDMGIVTGSVSDLNAGCNYEMGCPAVRGACHFGPVKQDDEDLVAWGTPETLGEMPSFEFIESSAQPSAEDSAVDETDCWDARYKKPELCDIDGDVQWISHMASPEEIQRYNDNLEKEKEAVEICKEKIAKHNLDMKLVTSHFLLSEPKLLFFFTSEDRVDFRELVKDLVSVFKTRIELRQIGVRDESRVLGGLAVCGRDFCCHSVSDKLDPVTIKMAKEQNLSLNSMKISGPCGRLLCCLSYEYNFYCEEKQSYPVEGTKLKIGDEFFKITEINILSKTMTALGSEGGTITIPRAEVYYSDKNDRWEVSKKFRDEFLGN